MPSSKLPRLRGDRAEVGVGTLIVFIAMVLVAAVAAAVIIGTSGSLQQRAQAVGQEATQDVSSNVRVVNVYGVRDTAADDISSVRLFLSLSAGSPPVDLGEMILRYTDGANVVIYELGDPTNPFTLSWIRGPSTDNAMEAGDLVELAFDVDPELAERTSFDLSLLPITGAPQELSITTPPTYSSDLYIDLQ